MARRDRRIAELVERQRKHRDEIHSLRDRTKTLERLATDQSQRLVQAESRLQSARELAERTEYPAFGVMLSYYRSYIRRARILGAQDAEPVLQIPRKLRNISLAKSHGIPVPRIYRVWNTVHEIDLSGLPDTFVLKADGGASGDAVFPLQRAHGSFRIIGAGDALLTESEIRQKMRTLGGRARPPYFVEEYVPPNDPGHPVPDDVKVYMFYGEPAQVLLMRVADTANRRIAVRKYLDPQTGAGLGEVLRGGRIDSGIPTPPHLPEIVNAARHLSRASGVAFCRVDFFDTPAGPVFGEITSAPGGRQHYEYDHDAGMAQEWLDARIRLTIDQARGRPDGALWGPQPYEWHYSDRPDPRNPDVAASHVTSCEEWCRI